MLNFHLSWQDTADEVLRQVEQAYAPTKQAFTMQQVTGPVADVTGFKPGPINSLWGGPRPLSSMLAGGALGAGAGYGLGWLAEKIFPGLEKNRLRKTMGLLGGALGAAPGVYQSIDNWSQGRSVLDQWPPPAKQGSLLDLAEEAVGLTKDAQDWAQPSMFADNYTPVINRNEVGQLVWSDPYLQPQMAAATDGLLAAASTLRGGANLVSPMDVARIAVGMGSGLVSGLVVGKTLGALAGLSDGAQKNLQRAGIVAGLVSNIVPMAFRGR